MTEKKDTQKQTQQQQQQQAIQLKLDKIHSLFIKEITAGKHVPQRSESETKK